MWSTRKLIVASVSLAPLAAGGQGSAATQSAPPPIRLSGLASSGYSSGLNMPTQAGSYRLANTAPSGGGGSGVEYVYQNGGATIRVSVGPYPASPPTTLNDTLGLVQASVEPIRDAVEQASQNGDLQAYHKLNDRADQIRLGSQTVYYYWYLAEVQPIGADGKYTYYAAYALPYGLVRIRGELPWAAPPPTNSLSLSMVPVTPMGTVGGVQSAVDVGEGDVAFGTGGLQSQRGGGLGTESTPRTVAPPVADQGAAPYRQQFVTFSNDLIGALVSHPAAASAQAQSSASVPPAKVTEIPAACAAVPAATDTVTYRVYATIVAPGHGKSLPPGYLDLVLDAVRQSYRVPNPLRPRAVAPMAVGGNTVMAPAVYGEVGFTLDPQGKLSDAGLTQSSMSNAMDRSLYNAVRLADSLQAFPAQIGVANPGPVRFFLDLSSYEPKGPHSAALFDVRLAAWHPGARPAVNVYVEPTIPVGVQYPTAGDSALIQFVVDNRGVPVESTVRLISATNLEVAEGVVHSALNSRYVPAMAAGCPVNGLLDVEWRMTR